MSVYREPVNATAGARPSIEVGRSIMFIHLHESIEGKDVLTKTFIGKMMKNFVETNHIVTTSQMLVSDWIIDELNKNKWILADEQFIISVDQIDFIKITHEFYQVEVSS